MRRMKWIGPLWAMMALIVLSLPLAACSQTAVDKRAARPDWSERFKQDAVTGEVTAVGNNYVAIKNVNGETSRVRVDDQTKMDHVMAGDHVKAYVSEDGYASTIQRTAR